MERLTHKQVIERERECVSRQQCDRDCARCDLAMDADDILTAYDHVLAWLDLEETAKLTPKDAATIGRFREHIFSSWSYDRMAKIAKADSEDRLVILPCKVGDTVWVAVKGVRVKEVVECVVDEISIDSYAPFAVLRRKSALGRRWHSYYIECFGKSVFLSREEAEAALASRRGDEK